MPQLKHPLKPERSLTGSAVVEGAEPPYDDFVAVTGPHMADRTPRIPASHGWALEDPIGHVEDLRQPQGQR